MKWRCDVGRGIEADCEADRVCVTHLEHGTEYGTSELTLAGDNQNVLDAVNCISNILKDTRKRRKDTRFETRLEFGHRGHTDGKDTGYRSRDLRRSHSPWDF